MSNHKEFNIPPVIFPSNPNPNHPHHRRAPTSTFTPSPNPNPNPLPFVSYDFGSAATTSAPFSSSPAINSLSFDDELPLLEELGINTPLILRKTLSVLNPFRLRNPANSAAFIDSADLSGPFILTLSFALINLLAGKFYFGIVLGWLTICSLFVYVVYNMLAGRNGNLDLYTCLSLLGYCMLPLVIFSAVAVVVPAGVWRFGLGAVFVLWSTRVCTGLLVELNAGGGDEHRGLIGYACWLVYMLFALLVVF